jgi:glycosyltransferase involved in cell wall biosynthesis
MLSGLSVMGRILFVQYTNPAAYPPLEHSSRIFARKGWDVLFLGTGALGADALRFPPHERIEGRQISFCPGGWRQKLHYIQFCLWILWRTFQWRPQKVYASDPLSCPIGLALSFLSHLSVIYHEHDSPQSEVGGQRSEISKFMKFVLWARQQLARRASVCVLPNEQRAARFDIETGRSTVDALRSPLIVWNCPSLEEVSAPRIAHDGGDFWVLYHGSIVPSRLPRTVLSALALLPSAVKLRVIGYETVGHKGYVQELKQLASGLRIDERVEFVGAVPQRGDLLARCRGCDVGLALMPKENTDSNAQTMVGASNKPFDYLACGLALLVSDLPDWRRMFVDLGYGLACDIDDPKSIATALQWFTDHPHEMRQMGGRGRQRILAEWNYERQFEPVLEILSA